MNQEIKEVKVLLDSELSLYSLVPRPNGDIVVSCEDGSIYRVDGDRNKHKMFTVGGQASGVAMDLKSGTFISLDARVFLADTAHQAILIREFGKGADQDQSESSTTNEIAKEFEGEPFLGPNSIELSRSGGICK